jgi:hypothetical protein
MKYSENAHPSLRPILNIHRKAPSGVLNKGINLTEKIYSKSLSISKSTVLPRFINPFENKKVLFNLNLPPLECTQKIYNGLRNISTPHFNPITINTLENDSNADNTYKKRKNKRSRFFDHIKPSNLGELSFGDVREAASSRCFKNL